MQEKQTVGGKMSDWLRRLLSCCDEADDREEERPALQISGPTNFRREDITIPGLDPEQQRFIREKAISDAQKMWAHLQPLHSTPPGHFASPGNTTAMLPTYEEFTTPRPAPVAPSSPTATSPTSPTGRRPSSGWDKVKRHSRKISDSLKKPLGYQAVSGTDMEEVNLAEQRDSKYEMKALVQTESEQEVLPNGKVSEDGLSGEESELDRDSAKKLTKS